MTDNVQGDMLAENPAPQGDPAPSEPPPKPEETNLTPHQQFLNMLPEDMRADPTFMPYKGESVNEIISKLAKSHINVNKLVGADKNAILKIPSDPEDKDGWGAIYSKLGRPDDVKGYETDKYKEVPGVNEENLNKLAQIAYDKGISKEAFQSLAQEYFAQMGADKELMDKNLETQIEKYTQDLKGEWGQAYEAKTAKVLGALKQHATDDFKQLAADYPWVFDHPAVMKTIDNLLKMSDEDGGPAGRGESVGTMTPAEAKAAIAAMEGDAQKQKILMTPGHPQREHILAERSKLFKAAYGSKS